MYEEKKIIIPTLEIIGPKIIKPGVNVVLWRSNLTNELLLVQTAYADKKWSLPGGGLQIGESVVACGIRETKEETGFDIEIASMLACLSLRKSISTLICFDGTIIGGKMEPENPDEIMDVRWFGEYEIDELWKQKLVQPAQMYLIQIAFAGLMEIVFDWDRPDILVN